MSAIDELAALMEDRGRRGYGEKVTIAEHALLTAVAEPVRLHVEAKRYLCTTDSGYHEHLSSASRYTLTMQGGPMSTNEVIGFSARHHADDAVQLRSLETRTQT